MFIKVTLHAYDKSLVPSSSFVVRCFLLGKKASKKSRSFFRTLVIFTVHVKFLFGPINWYLADVNSVHFDSISFCEKFEIQL